MKKKKTFFGYIIFKNCWNRNTKDMFDDRKMSGQKRHGNHLWILNLLAEISEIWL